MYDFIAREAQVLAELASGAATSDICRRLHITSKTLETHITNIRARFDTTHRGRRGIIDGARALRAVAVVPAVLISAALTDGVVVLQDIV